MKKERENNNQLTLQHFLFRYQRLQDHVAEVLVAASISVLRSCLPYPFARSLLAGTFAGVDFSKFTDANEQGRQGMWRGPKTEPKVLS